MLKVYKDVTREHVNGANANIKMCAAKERKKK